MLEIAQDWLLSERAVRCHRLPALQVDTIEQAQAFVGDVGFAFFWPIKGIEAPDLYQAIAGGERDVTSEHDDPVMSKCWGWKDESLGSTRWYYAKLLRRKATLVAPRLQATFYALTRNYGDLEDYLEQVQDGILTHDARLIYEAVLQHGPLNTIELRQKANLGASSKARFERALNELQVDMKLLPVGVAEAGAWRYSFIYEIPMRHYPDLPIQTRQISTRQAWETLVRCYVEGIVAATTRQISQTFHVYEPGKRELQRVLESLVAQEAIVPGKLGDDEVWVATRFLQ